MQDQQQPLPQSDKPLWETPELTQSDVAEVTLAGAAGLADAGIFS